MIKVKIHKTKKRIPVPKKPPKIESNKKKYSRKADKNFIINMINKG
jgi:hypothetical protein